MPPKPGGKIVGEVPLLLETWRNAVGFEKNGLLVEIARQILEAVVFMHGRRVIHRDLKPCNLLVVEWEAKWTVKVADFGMARFVLPGEDALTTLVGSPHYVAPELMKGEKDYTEAVDIYSVGMVLWALIHEKDPMHEAGVYTMCTSIPSPLPHPSLSSFSFSPPPPLPPLPPLPHY
jgi:serine/threonine protein kinase